MEYTQITLTEWVNMKESLKKDIRDAQDKFASLKKDFVRIGYKLRKIEEEKLYEQDGYKSIAEFAKSECGLTSSDVTRFMKINERYSMEGYSEELRPEFLEYGSSKLAEMLALPDSDMEMITPEASRENIRELKRFNKEDLPQDETDDLKDLIEKFWHDNREALNELFSESAFKMGVEEYVKRCVDIVNPSGTRTFKKGLFFMMMYEQEIKIKKFGGTPQTMKWSEFLDITNEIFGEYIAGPKTWDNYFGEPEEEKTTPENVENTEATGDFEEKTEEKAEKPEGAAVQQTKEPEKEEPESIAPAQKTAEIQNAEPLGEPMNPPEVVDGPFGNRKMYLDTLTEYGAARYLTSAAKKAHYLADLTQESFWEHWLSKEVDDQGREMEECENV